MIQFCTTAGDIHEAIDAEAEREAAAAQRLRRRTGAREVRSIEEFDWDDRFGDQPPRMVMIGAKNVYKQFKYNRAATVTPGRALELGKTESDHRRAAERRERIALQARLINLTAHLPADQAREVCRGILAKLRK